MTQRQSERTFQATVVEHAQWLKWKVLATWGSRHSPAGEPDLRLIRPPRVIFAELKTEAGLVRASQREVLALLEQCPGVETYLWRPSDWPEIERILA